jgi:hypothetical protein
VFYDLAALQRYPGRILHQETDQPAARSHGPESQQRLAPVENWFVETDHRPEPGFERVGQGIGVLPDDQVAFLQAQDALRLDAKGTKAERSAGGQ